MTAALRFVDLFAGIGGFRLALEAQGCSCVFTCEIDRFCAKTYAANFRIDHPIATDIRKVDAKDVPDHDILVGGFPCPTFSLAGISKLNSLDRPSGFEDKTRGTLFFEILRILKEKLPQAFILENVANLEYHKKGQTFKIIRESLEELGYTVHWKVIDALGWVPQHRDRVFIVGFRQDVDFSWDYLAPNPGRTRLADILEPHVDPKYCLKDGTWNFLQKHKKDHAEKGNGFGYTIADPERHARTITARYHKDGSEILLPTNGNPRKLTPREALRLQGFPAELEGCACVGLG